MLLKSYFFSKETILKTCLSPAHQAQKTSLAGEPELLCFKYGKPYQQIRAEQ